MEETIRTLGILKARHFSARLDTVRLRTGRETERIKIDHPEAAAILAFPDRDHILMVRQWRYAIGGETLEIPAGKVDPGESAEVCAAGNSRRKPDKGHRGCSKSSAIILPSGMPMNSLEFLWLRAWRGLRTRRTRTKYPGWKW